MSLTKSRSVRILSEGPSELERAPKVPPKEQRRLWLAAQTREALRRFEEGLREAQDVDDLPTGAEAEPAALEPSRTGHGAEAWDRSPERSGHLGRSAGLEAVPPQTGRPPTALGMYDYGCISLKPKSVYAQCTARFGDSMKSDPSRPPKVRRAPGAGFRGTTLQDPCLLPPRSWAETSPPPVRWSKDSEVARPLGREAIMTLRRNASSGPSAPAAVRVNAAHELRARLALQVLDNRREEAVLEQAIFENGVYEGRWPDPLLEGHGCLPELVVPAHHDWMRTPPEEMDQVQQQALRVLLGLGDYMSRYAGRILDLFAAENQGPKGVLEPAEFAHGLCRLNVVHAHELSIELAIQIAAVVDPNFDGRVSLPALQRAIAAARALRGGPRQRAGEARKSAAARTAPKRAKLPRDSVLGGVSLAKSASAAATMPGGFGVFSGLNAPPGYGAGDGAGLSAIRLEMMPKSKFIFERSAEAFRSQQLALLVRYGEARSTEVPNFAAMAGTTW